MAEPLPAKLLGETITVEFDFTDVMLWGETLDSGAITVSVVSGLDPSPQVLLNGSAELAGRTISQSITQGRPGVVYALTATADCSGGTSYQKVRKLAVLSDEGSFQPSSLVRLVGTLPNAIVGQAYSEPLTIVGGYAPYRYDGIESGAAPFWMNFHVEDALLICAGMPNETVSTEYLFSPRIADAANNLADDPQDIFSNILEIVGDVPDGDINTSVSGAYTNVGGTAPVTYSILSGTFPVTGGLNSDGTYSGTLDTAGHFSWVVEGIDANGVHAQLPDSNVVRAAQFMYVGATGGTVNITSSLDTLTWAKTNITGGNRTLVRYHESIIRCGSSSGTVSFNNGSTWQSCTGFTGNTVFGGVYSNGIWVLATSPGVTRSSNGVNFTYTSPSGGIPAIGIACSGSTVVIAAYSSAISFDKGATWTKSSGFTFNGGIYSCNAIANKGTFFIAACSGNSVAGDNAIYSTTDGLHWTRLTSPFTGASDNKCIAYDPVSDRWGITNGRSFAYSDNDGASWTLVGTIVPSGFSIMNNSLLCYNGVWSVSCNTVSDPRIYSSLDNGLTWAQRTPIGMTTTIFGGAVGLILP